MNDSNLTDIELCIRYLYEDEVKYTGLDLNKCSLSFTSTLAEEILQSLEDVLKDEHSKKYKKAERLRRIIKIKVSQLRKIIGLLSEKTQANESSQVDTDVFQKNKQISKLIDTLKTIEKLVTKLNVLKNDDADTLKDIRHLYEEGEEFVGTDLNKCTLSVPSADVEGIKVLQKLVDCLENEYDKKEEQLESLKRRIEKKVSEVRGLVGYGHEGLLSEDRPNHASDLNSCISPSAISFQRRVEGALSEIISSVAGVEEELKVIRRTQNNLIDKVGRIESLITKCDDPRNDDTAGRKEKIEDCLMTIGHISK